MHSFQRDLRSLFITRAQTLEQKTQEEFRMEQTDAAIADDYCNSCMRSRKAKLRLSEEAAPNESWFTEKFSAELHELIKERSLLR